MANLLEKPDNVASLLEKTDSLESVLENPEGLASLSVQPDSISFMCILVSEEPKCMAIIFGRTREYCEFIGRAIE